MRIFAVAALLGAMIVSVVADGSLYIAENTKEGTVTVEKGQLVMRTPVVKEPVTDAHLRYDSEDRSILWLELHMPRWIDPGDVLAYFAPAEKGKEQFSVGGSKIHKEGCTWTMRFSSLESGRKALRQIAEAYELEVQHAVDKTKG